jgi:hypothetical protein
MTTEAKIPHAPEFQAFLEGKGTLNVEYASASCPYHSAQELDDIIEWTAKGAAGIASPRILVDALGHKENKGNLWQIEYAILLDGEHIGAYTTYYNHERVTSISFMGTIPRFPASGAEKKLQLDVCMESGYALGTISWGSGMRPVRKDAYTAIPFRMKQ